jgi:hypothetical protein
MRLGMITGWCRAAVSLRPAPRDLQPQNIMRTISLTFSAILLMATLENAASKPATVVYPTGIFPTDVQNVQAAINRGGTVLLKATDSVGHPLAFNFGPPDPNIGTGVNVVNDVSITGELVGGDRTTIDGGATPILVLGGRSSIIGMRFDGPLRHAIRILGSAGTQIVGNEIANVVPLGTGPLTISDGIDVFPSFGRPATDITGNLIISGNTFGDLSGSFAIAVQVDSVAANVTISNNTFQLGQLATDAGFNNSAAISCLRCHSVVTISGNMITIGLGIVFDGISIEGDADARYHVFDNTINCQGPWPDGIDVFGQTGAQGPTVSAVIERNSITVHNEFFTGIGLVGAVSNCTVQGNTVTGDAGAALVATFLFPNGDLVSSNRFLNNDITSLNASLASIFFDTNTLNNLVRGQCVSVLDLGTGNDVSCPNPASHAASFPTATRQQLIQRALQSQGAVHASASSP